MCCLLWCLERVFVYVCLQVRIFISGTSSRPFCTRCFVHVNQVFCTFCLWMPCKWINAKTPHCNTSYSTHNAPYALKWRGTGPPWLCTWMHHICVWVWCVCVWWERLHTRRNINQCKRVTSSENQFVWRHNYVNWLHTMRSASGCLQAVTTTTTTSGRERRRPGHITTVWLVVWCCTPSPHVCAVCSSKCVYLKWSNRKCTRNSFTLSTHTHASVIYARNGGQLHRHEVNAHAHIHLINTFCVCSL